MLKKLVKFVITVLICLALLLGVLNLYFHFVFPIRNAVLSAANETVKSQHVHVMSFEQIPSTYKDAVISTEDRRFYSDPGIDAIGIARSLIVDIQQDGYIEGGSTITQQLVDNTLLSKRKTLHRKILQVLYAIGIYDTMEKKRVFQLYTNVIYFGHGAYGLYNAAQVYFGCPPKACNEGELTMLAGLPNAPSVYDPFKDMALARERQKIVLQNMVDNGLISASKAKAIYKEPIKLKGH